MDLVFSYQRSRRNSKGITPNGGAKYRWGRSKSKIFGTIISPYLRNGAR